MPSISITKKCESSTPRAYTAFWRLREEIFRGLISQKKVKHKIVLFSAYDFPLQSTTATEYGTNNNLCSPFNIVYNHINAGHLLDTSRASELVL